jgi:hypothetical protein
LLACSTRWQLQPNIRQLGTQFGSREQLGAVEAATSHKHHKPGSRSSHKPQAPQARQSEQPQATSTTSPAVGAARSHKHHKPGSRSSHKPQPTLLCATLLCVPRTGRQHPPEQPLVPSNDVPIVLADAREGPGGRVLHVRVRIVNPSDHDRDALGEREIHRDNEGWWQWQCGSGRVNVLMSAGVEGSGA